MVFENEYQLEYSVGQRTADRLFAQMGRAIAKMEGLDTERVNRKETITELSEWTKSLFPGKNIILNVTDL